MYTESYKTELEFWAELCRCGDSILVEEKVLPGPKCPVCKEGRITTECIRTDYGAYEYHHQCGYCGHVFDMAKIRCDALLHQPYERMDSLPTPFGELQVEINGDKVAFLHGEDVYSHDEKPITIHHINISVADLHIGDEIFCGFKSGTLEHDDSDEHTTLSICENGKYVLGLCAYEPEDWGSRIFHCYDLMMEDGRGFIYEILRDPAAFDEWEVFESKNIQLKAAWVKKSEYIDPAEDIGTALL